MFAASAIPRTAPAAKAALIFLIGRHLSHVSLSSGVAKSDTDAPAHKRHTGKENAKVQVAEIRRAKQWKHKMLGAVQGAEGRKHG